MAGLLPLFGITLWQSYNWKTKYLEVGTAPISWTILLLYQYGLPWWSSVRYSTPV